MFLLCFARNEMMGEISRVSSDKVAKGKSMLVTTIGNKGGLAYSFVYKN